MKCSVLLCRLIKFVTPKKGDQGLQIEVFRCNTSLISVGTTQW